jgi:hypothetical protein
MVREFAKAVHGKSGKVIFVNITKPSESIWGDVIDYWVEWDCDTWVADLKDRRKEIWLPLGVSNDTASKDEKPKTVAKNPAATRPDVTNGAYLTMKIVDQLGRLSGRISDITDQNRNNEQGSVTPINTDDGAKKRKKPSPPRPNSVRPNKENGAYLVYEIISNLRRLATWATIAPLSGKLPLGTVSGNIPGRPQTKLKHLSSFASLDLPELPTPPSSDLATSPLTPGAQRIKSLGSISAILSSPLRYWRDR